MLTNTLLLVALWAFEAPTFTPFTNLFDPQALTVNAQGRIFVADTAAHRVVVLDSQGKQLFAFGQEGQGPGDLNTPSSVAVLADGTVVVADHGNSRVQLFDGQGRHLKILKPGNHSIGAVYAMPDSRFLVTASNGFSFHLKLDGSTPKRFYVYDLEGNLLESFGQYRNHENPFLQLYLNTGGVAMMGERLYFAGRITNELSVYENGEATTGLFQPAFPPAEPVAAMQEKKEADGNISYFMKVEADNVCLGLAALPSDELLLLRTVQKESDGDSDLAPSELVRIGHDGKVRHKYPNRFQAKAMAVSPDHRHTYLILETDDGWSIERFSL